MAFKTDCVDRETPPVEAPTREPHILVVEDDWSTRRFICSVLKRSTGALVMDAQGPLEALSLARSMGQPPDLLISDIGLHAAKTGVDLAHEMIAENPSIKILLISGGDFPSSGIPAPWRFLAKPFPLSVFLDCVHALCPKSQPHNNS